jgi:hypothetical protein
MKFFGHDAGSDGKFAIGFERGEKALLFRVLSLYPLVPTSYHRLTKDKKLPRRDENQQLLDDALKYQREQNRREILALINTQGRFAGAEGAEQVSFTRGDLEWLLQVMNDVRVGCWIALGSPGYEPKKINPKDRQAVEHAVSMEIAGGFEMFFLGVINGDVPPESQA